MNWGRFSLVPDAETADLVISVRRRNGKVVNPTIGRVPNDRPVIAEPIDSGIRVGGQHGAPAPVTEGSPPPYPRGAVTTHSDVDRVLNFTPYSRRAV